MWLSIKYMATKLNEKPLEVVRYKDTIKWVGIKNIKRMHLSWNRRLVKTSIQSVLIVFFQLIYNLKRLVWKKQILYECLLVLTQFSGSRRRKSLNSKQVEAYTQSVRINLNPESCTICTLTKEPSYSFDASNGPE